MRRRVGRLAVPQRTLGDVVTRDVPTSQRVSDMASIFADVHRHKARTGWQIQDDNGNWKRK